MARLTLEYNAQNHMARKIIEIILSMDGLFKVKSIVTEHKKTSIVDKKKAAAMFIDKWAGKFIINEKETNDSRYNYLVQKYK